MKSLLLYFLSVILLLSSCTVPRTMTMSGKVTPKKQAIVGWNPLVLYIPTATPKYIFNGAKKAVLDYKDKDTIAVDDIIIDANKMLYAYCADPLKVTTEIYGRYGIYEHFDLGYKYSIGTHVFDARYQFLGSVKTHDNPSDDKFFGSIGIQYSQSKYDLKNKVKINYLQDLLGYTFARKDILIPLVFSYSFGKEEEDGALGFGAVYGHTFTNYSYLPTVSIIKNNGTQTVLTGLKDKNDYSSLGMFINVKGGMKWIYAVMSLAVYKQNYGNFKLINDEIFGLKGWTIVPSLGVQYYFGRGID
jgi:hypothetical protein